MNIIREDLPGRQVALTIELETDMVNDAMERAYRQMVNQVNIPGFRRGKAPRYMVERYMGTEALTERAVKNILPQTVQDAITAQNIEAMDVGEVEIVNMDPLQVKVVIVQPPVVKLGDYSGVRVEREQTEVTQEQIEEVLSELRREGAPWNEVAEPRPIKEGDMVYLDLEGFTGEGELPEVKREQFPTLVGSERGGIPMVVNNALVGMTPGEEKDITDTLPEDYPIEEMRGRDVSYHVKAHSIKEQEVPELDEEFAKKMGFDSVDVLRETVEKNLRERTNESAESNQVNHIIAHILEGAEVDVPDLLVREELDNMLKSLEDRLKQQRLTLRQYFTFNGVNEDEWRQQNTERAREQVVRNLVLQEFASREGLDVDEAEVTAEVENMLSQFEGEQKEQARIVLGGDEAKHDLQDRIFQRKLVDRLVGIAEGKIEAAPVPEGEAQSGAEAEAGETSETGEIGESESANAEAAVRAEAEEGGDASDTESTEDDAPAKGEDSLADASTLESAGGAAEVLGTGDIDLSSPNETGEAPGGGTPSTAPALEESGS